MANVEYDIPVFGMGQKCYKFNISNSKFSSYTFKKNCTERRCAAAFENSQRDDASV